MPVGDFSKENPMTLILNTQPMAEPVSLAEAKAHLRISHTDDDVYVSTLIIAARRQIESRTGLRCIQQGWSVFHDQWPEDRTIRIPLEPLLSIDDIRIYGDDDTFAVLDPAHYFIDKSALPARVILRGSRERPCPGRVANGIEVRLTAGFGPDGTLVPKELKQAILLTIADWFANRGDERSPALPLNVMALIAPYRSMRIA
jgi:uncharacterized phiE125 gp8 family phage protein